MCMLTTTRKFKRHGGARALQINGGFYTIFLSKPTYSAMDGVKSLLVTIILMWPCLDLKHVCVRKKSSVNNMVINPAIVNFPDKFNYPTNYRYGLNLLINRQMLHVFLLILLAGDIATNPGTQTKPNLHCLSFNALKVFQVQPNYLTAVLLIT